MRAGPSHWKRRGAKAGKRPQLEESLGALRVALSAEDLARLEAAIPRPAVAGTRYGDEQMKSLDSER